jgi:hypothetical protein
VSARARGVQVVEEGGGGERERALAVGRELKHFGRKRINTSGIYLYYSYRSSTVVVENHC